MANAQASWQQLATNIQISQDRFAKFLRLLA